MTTTEILRQAKRELETRGWCQGGMGISETGGLCAAKAIALAGQITVPVLNGMCGPSGPLGLFAQVAVGTSDTLAIPRWNDKPHRTVQEVLDAFDAAIEIAAQQEQEQSVREEVPCAG